MNTAIIVAAGSGTRFGSATPKQFLKIGDKPLLIHTLKKFENCSQIDEIVLVIASDQMSNYRKIAVKHQLRKVSKVVFGGQTRAESVAKGLGVIDSHASQLIAVHDGARPFVTNAEIIATLDKARETGAACLTALVTDTIKQVSDGRIVGTVNRLNLRRALTPQAFRADILKAAFADADLSDAATDECYLVERLGFPIAVVDGSAGNIKITTPEDWELAKILLRNGND